MDDIFRQLNLFASFFRIALLFCKSAGALFSCTHSLIDLLSLFQRIQSLPIFFSFDVILSIVFIFDFYFLLFPFYLCTAAGFQACGWKT